MNDFETYLRADLLNLDFTPLTLFMEKLCDEIEYGARQGSSDSEWKASQAMCVAEEAGEFLKEYRRWWGFARKAGDKEKVLEELSDVVISSFIMFAVLGEDAQIHIKEKLRTVISRGYVNKEAEVG